MSLKTRFFSIAALAIATAAFSTFVSAQETPTTPQDGAKQEKRQHKAFGKRGDHEKGMRSGRHGGMRGLYGIELSDAQKEQLRLIRESNRPNDALRQEMRTLAVAKRDGTITAEQTEKLKALKLQRRENGEAVRLQIEAILTPEQRQQIETRKTEMKQKMQERRQMRQQNNQPVT